MVYYQTNVPGLLETITELKTCLACVLDTTCTQGLIIRRGHFFDMVICR